VDVYFAIFIYALKPKTITNQQVATLLRGLLKAPIPRGSSRKRIGEIDVVVLTKNSERQFERCLSAIYGNVPVNRLIVVDGNSTDKTLEILGKFEKRYGNVVLIQNIESRGYARQIGIKNVETEWFMFVDSDAILCKGWFEKAKALISEKVGAIWGIEIWSGIRNPNVQKLFLKVTRKIFEYRGGTHDLLVRHKAVKDIAIPKDLHVFEDAFIKKWIDEKGYKVVAAYDPYCLHARPESAWTTKGSIDIIVDTLRFTSLRKMPKYILAYGFYAAIVIHHLLSRKKSLQSSLKGGDGRLIL